MFEAGHDIWNVWSAMRSHHAGWDLVRGGKSLKCMRPLRERARADVFAISWPAISTFPMQQTAWHAGVRDRRLAERPPRLAARPYGR